MTHRTQANTLLNIYWFTVNDIIKDTNEQLVEEVYRARSGRVLSTGTSVPRSWGVPPFWHVEVLSNPELSKPCWAQLSWSLHYVGMVG